MKKLIGDIIRLFRRSAQEWSEDHASRLAAAVAYYTIFSLAPLMVIVIAIAGLLWQRSVVQQHIMNQVQGLVGAQGAGFVATLIARRGSVGQGIVATVVGIVALLFGALGAFAELHDSLNAIWDVQEKPAHGFWQGARRVISDRLLSFTVIVGIGFLLLVSLVISTALSAIQGVIGGLIPISPGILQVINLVISIGVITVLFALMFKVLPDASVAWRDVWWGALMTAVLFAIGKTVIGLYLGRSNVASYYGAAGSLIILLLWVYYSAQILFFGAELTQVYANEFGSGIVPDADAEYIHEPSARPLSRPHAGQPHGSRALGPAAVPITGSPDALERENRQTVRALAGMVAASFIAGLVTTMTVRHKKK